MNLSPDDSAAANRCVSIIHGVSDTLYFLKQNEATGKGLPCIPQQTTDNQTAKVVAKYLQEHPEKLHEHDSYLVVQALFGAYPCT
jgi:hypothetical protein